ncbi:MAG: transglycosylase domain-containing protein [Bryobacteraceae bacterium]|nr:transglycosylase domain-containing protein [Bryobacteraceae bacterium]
MPKTVERLLHAAGQLSGDDLEPVSILHPEPATPKRNWPWLWILLTLITFLLMAEARFSWLQSFALSWLASHATYRVQPGDGRIPALTGGPYDARLGYSLLPTFTQRLTREGFTVDAQARWSETLGRLASFGLPPIYREKNQAGLTLLDGAGQNWSVARYPGRIYPTFESIPPVVIKSLLFIENRELLDEEAPHRNPAVEWDRFARAIADLGMRQIKRGTRSSGGSTLITQLEKVRHSPEGRTATPGDKLKQMLTASLRAYQEGPSTLAARRQVVCDYLNSLPLASVSGHGEVIGLGDGVWAWYGADFERTNRLLKQADSGVNRASAEQGAAYRQALSLLLAINRPGHYLQRDPAALSNRTAGYIRVLAEMGLIPETLRDAALAAPQTLRTKAPATEVVSFAERKALDSVRNELVNLLGVDGYHQLDRLDLTAKTTINRTATDATTATLRRLAEPEFAASSGIFGERLLQPEAISQVIYSFTLYERGAGANYLRVQADNYNQPLSINEGTMLELGSTAKLRTLITYLESIAAIRTQLLSEKPANWRAEPRDPLTQWCIDYLRTAKDPSLRPMLEAAMDRTYSASPGEGFFTGGGQHVFSNFDPSDNGRILTVRESLHRSVNLVFIRVMRDVVSYYLWSKLKKQSDILDTDYAPERQGYLSRFADREGKEFLARFQVTYSGLAPYEALEKLLTARPVTLDRAALIFRSIRPDAGWGNFGAFLKAHALEAEDLEALYARYDPSRLSLNDRAYLAHVHPLELWLVAYWQVHPEAAWSELEAASSEVRQESYQWLFRSRHKHAQDVRIRTLMEEEAFVEIAKSWRRLGYPFVTLVPSYATALGSSGDTPAALAELAGIILNQGIRQPAVRLQGLHFGAGTPFETVLSRQTAATERVLPVEVAQVVHEGMLGVVAKGTARMAFDAVRRDGQIVPVGGKTGTGDNRYQTFAAPGVLSNSRAVNRTATFVFTIGDRYFGTVVAYVPGDLATGQRFTSALPVQVFRTLIPALEPVLAAR